MTDATKWYANVFKTWQVKLMGPKPTAEHLTSIHHLGARPGKQALANAMSLRECGVTNLQIIAACGAPQLNKMRGFISDGYLKRLPTAPDGKNHQVYRCEVTPKGLKRIEKRAAMEAAAEANTVPTDEAAPKPAKAKAKKATSKARKPRNGLPVVTATGEAEVPPAADTGPVNPVMLNDSTADTANATV